MNITPSPLAAALLACLIQTSIAQDNRGPGGPPPLPLVTALDANNDQVIDSDEKAGAPAALGKLDANRDGKLTPEEYRPQRMGPGGPAGPGGRGPGGVRPGGGQPASFEARTLPQDDEEKKILEVLADLNRNQRQGNMTVPEQDGRILRLFTESLGARRVVEIGTSIGYSGIWFCLGFRKTDGTLTTFEIDPGRAAKARENFKRAGVADHITLVEGDAHAEVAKVEAGFDILFLDADKEGYIDYLEKLLPKLRPGGLVIAHNMNARMADPKYVAAITSNPGLETLFLNMETSGIGVSLKKR